MGKKNTFIGGAAVQKELQGLAAFVAYQDVVNRGASMTKGALEQVMGDAFFGDPTDSDSIGLAEQVVKGIGVFRGLYSAIDSSADMCCIGGDDEDESISSLSTTGTSTVNVLKPYLHCLGSHKRIVSGPPYGIHLKLMHRKGLKDDTIAS
jgi:hypothetical protein